MGKLEEKDFKWEKFKSLFWDAVKFLNQKQLKGKLKAIKKGQEKVLDTMTLPIFSPKG